jgi:hypothetical protein
MTGRVVSMEGASVKPATWRMKSSRGWQVGQEDLLQQLFSHTTGTGIGTAAWPNPLRAHPSLPEEFGCGECSVSALMPSQRICLATRLKV